MYMLRDTGANKLNIMIVAKLSNLDENKSSFSLITCLNTFVDKINDPNH